MSLLICSLCEQNREPVAKTVLEAIQTLGKEAKGQNKFLSTCACSKCGLKEKKFIFNLEINVYGPMFYYEVEMDAEGNYTIRPRKDGMLYRNEYNHLHLINMVKEQIDSLVVSDARGLRIFTDQKVSVGAGTDVACICGNTKFSNISSNETRSMTFTISE